MGADGFSVDHHGLARLGRQLADLRAELRLGDEAIRPLLATISDDDLRRKLSEFAENWSDKRDLMMKSLDEASTFATQAAATYAAADKAGADGFNGRAP